MKWNHLFNLVSQGDSYRIYQCDDIEARFDFFAHMMRAAIYKKGQYLFPTYSVCPGESKMPRHGRDRLSIEGLEPSLQKDTIQIDDIRIEINPQNLRVFCFKGGKLLYSDRDGLAYNLQGELGSGSHHYLFREPGEHIYGLGDKTGDINKAGRNFKMETFDTMGFDANSSDPLYKQVPFYMCKNSVGCYGIFYDTYSNGEIDFGREHNNYYIYYKHAHFEEEALVYYVIFGELDEILHRFMHLTGKAALPPKWSFSYCGSTMAYTDAPDTEQQLRNFLDLTQKYDIDCGGFYLSSGYTQIGDNRYVFHWNKDKIPDPKKLSQDFLAQGIHFLPNVKPAFLTDHPFYESLAKKGWFLHYPDGTPATFPFWGGAASYLDFTNDEAFEFWTDCIKKNLVDFGYDSIWNDNNEFDVHDEEILADGWGHPLPAKRIRPLFPLLMSMASREAIASPSRVMAVSRSGCAGMERVVQTWTGDNRTSFEDFRGNHKMAMTMALSGFRFFGQDIGGFAGPRPDKELFLRWIQYGIFTPRFTLHSWNDDRSSNMPWLYPDMMDEVKALFHLREALLPYIYSEANRSIEEYQPLIKPVFLSEPDYDEESDSFYFGDSILSCPVFDQGKEEIDIRLPRGKWYRNGRFYEGDVRVPAPIHGLPVYFIKDGSVIPMDEDGITFHIYASEEGIIHFPYYESEDNTNVPRVIEIVIGKEEVRVSGIRENENVALHDEWNRQLFRVQ
ncbi:MAG: alpha-glucosidase [Bacilli bacterium]|nr:alpha-glucosidase [Bacilli bacterium]